MKRCKHNQHIVRDGDMIDTVDGPVQRLTKRCGVCGEWLSLGPANDDDANVRVEIAAASYASMAENGGDSISIGHHLYRNDLSSWYGWCQHAAVHDYDDDASNVRDHELAGYLARCIVTHDGAGS